ncbi:hypothetical protein LXA43DRAFT_987429 [Ganoderma leucocontextum]|nr:hypothetical protein LXA43DRAFT_987429 [Ganoderma leucocontextum]
MSVITRDEDVNPLTFDYSTLNARRIPHPKSLGCYWCHKRGSSSQQLKRCAKCSIVLYCCKECQVASWPTHKRECVSQGESAHQSKLTKAYRKWIEVHQLSLYALSAGLIRSTGGIEFNLANTRSLLVTLIPHTESWDDGNLAEAFSIADAQIFDKDENLYARAEWIGGRPQDREAALRELVEKDPQTEVLGVFPVTYLIANERTTMHDLHPIRRQDPDILGRRQSKHAGLEEEEEEFVADAYADLANLSIACVNVGLVFHDPKDQRANEFLPDVGTYSRAKRGASWRWVRMAGAWEMMNRIMQMPDSGMDRAGLTAEQLWKMWGLWY